MTAAERRFLWNQYPKIMEMFEEYNSILLEDDGAWGRLVNRCHGIADSYHGDMIVEMLLADAVYQLEKLAKKRKGI